MSTLKKTTFNKGANCTTSLLGLAELSLEGTASSANPTLFSPLMLPPYVEAPLTGTPPTSMQRLLSSPTEERALGFKPAIGWRAAFHYGMDRRAWERQAALRMW
mgnify:CR=1 FL=1